jgi:hypothetical protein
MLHFARMQNADAMGAPPNPAPDSLPDPASGAAFASATPPLGLLPAPASGTSPGSDLAWRVVGLANLYRLLVPPALYAV